MYTILLLGGTSEAKRLAVKLLAFKQVDLIYSLAGLVRKPNLACQIHIGGFQGKMAQYLLDQNIDLVIDTTHPYAVNITQIAIEATQATKIPYWHYQRPAWQKSKLDHWIPFHHWQHLYPQLLSYQRPFFALGREPLQQLKQMPKQQTWLVRTAIDYTMKQSVQHDRLHLIQAIGYFSEQDEMQLFQQYNIDVLVCKNSGGTAVSSKLAVARKLNIPIFMQQRPVVPILEYIFSDIDAIILSLAKQLK